MTRLHESVLEEEVLAYLAPACGQMIIDGTLGAGGHARAILEKVKPSRLIGLDQDPRALEEAGRVLEPFGDRVMIQRGNFRDISKALDVAGISCVQAILLDLGVSSMQLVDAERGFSFRGKGPLDMRMDPSEALNAEEVVNDFPQEKLETILWQLGEERFSRRIVKRIVAARSQKRIRNTLELAQMIAEAVPASYRSGRLHPATRTFQAIRMAVNRELDALSKFLSQALQVLDSRGRLVIISFHSLEDRLVKRAFQEFQKEKWGAVLTKKPVTARLAEVKQNPRSRSAKLRAFEKA